MQPLPETHLRYMRSCTLCPKHVTRQLRVSSWGITYLWGNQVRTALLRHISLILHLFRYIFLSIYPLPPVHRSALVRLVIICFSAPFSHTGELLQLMLPISSVVRSSTASLLLSVPLPAQISTITRRSQLSQPLCVNRRFPE